VCVCVYVFIYLYMDLYVYHIQMYVNIYVNVDHNNSRFPRFAGGFCLFFRLLSAVLPRLHLLPRAAIPLLSAPRGKRYRF